MEMVKLVNKVSESGIITLDLETFVTHEEIVEIDLKEFLFRGLILKEKEFRMALKERKWDGLEGKTIALFCSADAILPQWAYMLLVSALQPYANNIYYGNKEQVEEKLLLDEINGIKMDMFKDQKVVVKGCGTRKLPDSAYLEISKKLLPVVKSLMFGEPCSTVPVFKRKEN